VHRLPSIVQNECKEIAAKLCFISGHADLSRQEMFVYCLPKLNITPVLSLKLLWLLLLPFRNWV
jgi:hypothetical protein